MKELTSVNEWHDVLEKSKEEPVLVLKHSTTCPISAAAYQEYDASAVDVPKYFLKIQDNRPVSDEIANDLGIRHESPQLFLVKDGKATWQATHHAINQSKIGEAVKENV